MNLDYIVREPENITPQTPILFMIHGYGSNEQDLFSLREDLPKDWILVSFRAPKPVQIQGFGFQETQAQGYCWYDINFNNPEEFINIEQAKESVTTLMENIMKIVNRYELTEGKTHLCGFSQGGVLSLYMALKYPELFSHVAILSGYAEEKLLTDIVKDKKKLSNLRFFFSHGTDDGVIPIEWARKGAELLYDLGCYFSFREYMSGHGINQKNYMDLMAFFSK